MNLLLVLFLFLNAAHLILAVNEPNIEKFRPSFDEIYGKVWDEDNHEKIKVEKSPSNTEEQADHDDNIDQDVEAYNSDSTDQNFTQEDADRIDQSDDEELIKKMVRKNSLSKKREIIFNFHALKEEYKKKGKFPETERVKIEQKIGNKLGVNRDKIYKWKKEFGLSRKTKINKKSFYKKKKREFIARIEEIKMCQPGEQNKLVKNLDISDETFRCWKKEFGLPVNSQIIYSESEKLELMRKYYKIKQRNSKISESDIAKRLNISAKTLYRWKKQFDPILDQNSVDEQHSFPENRPTFADNDTSQHPMPSSSNDNLWAWNFAKKKRTERIEVETP